jgi:hypothetical protein
MLVDSGKVRFAEQLAGLIAREGFDFHLYTNPVAWAHYTTLGDLTEAAWTSYAPSTVPTTNWGSLAFDSNFDAVLQATVLTSFINGSGTTQTALGFFVTGSASGILYGGAAFSVPLAIGAGATVSSYSQLLVNTL